MPACALPCAAAPSGVVAASMPPPTGVIFMRDSGRLHVFALPAGSAPVHQYVRGLPANLTLGEDADAPTLVTVLAPLRFDAITLFPAYYLTREVEYASPKVTIAKGTALHRVERGDGSRCNAYLGFSDEAEPHAFDFDGGEILGQYAPALDIGPVEVPCDALGGTSETPPLLARSTDAEGDSKAALRLTPVRDEDGAEHYVEADLRVFAEPSEDSATLWLKGTLDGSEILANSPATLLEERQAWKKIRLTIAGEVVIEGWVAAGEFEPDDGTGQGSDGHGRLGGYHRRGPPPTYCRGALSAGTRVFSGNGAAWATVAAPVEAAFDRQNEHLYLVNFFGAYRDSFCSPGPHPKDSQDIHRCIEDAEVRPEDVTLHCPAAPRERP